MFKEKVSVIIPAYNAEQYIETCLESLHNQSYHNLEILVIDDGSQDKTGEIVEKWNKIDDRICLLTNENHGVSYSRNYAIQRCTGTYITFVDADDIVAVDFVQTLVMVLEKNNLELAAVGIVKDCIAKENMFSEGHLFLYKGAEVMAQLFGGYEGFVFNKLYIADIIKNNNIKMDESISVSEDLLFNVNYLSHCQKTGIYDGKKYFYRQHKESAINRLDNPKWFEIIKVYETIYEFMSENNDVANIILYYFSMILYEAKFRAKYVGDMNLCADICMKIKKIEGINCSFTLKQRLKLFVFKCFPALVMKYKRRKL